MAAGKGQVELGCEHAGLGGAELRQQVASLVADGRTNREIGASLFMSAKTVEANLTHIYRKLGITCRRELTALMRGTDAIGSRVTP